MTEKQVQSVKRRLFCEEVIKKEDSPEPKEKRKTPISFDQPQEKTIFFLGFAFPYEAAEAKYKCQHCFERSFEAKTPEVKQQCIDQNTVYGEISLEQFYSRWQSRDDPANKCISCNQYLTVIRPYDTAHLVFE